MFRMFGIIDDFVNDIIDKIADLIVKLIEKLDIRAQLKKSMGDAIDHLEARHINLADLNSEEVSSNE